MPVLLIKHHPFVRELPAIPESCHDFAFDVTHDIAINELICSADAVISDYSSLVFEYSLFGQAHGVFRLRSGRVR